MLGEKEKFLNKCNEIDRKKLLRKTSMSFDDFERFLFLTDYVGSYEYRQEIFDTFIPEFAEIYVRMHHSDVEDMLTEEVEELVAKRRLWLKDFLKNIE